MFFPWIVFVIIIFVVINKAKHNSEGKKYRQELEDRAQNRTNSADKEKEAQRQREEAIRQAEARREEAVKRQEEEAKREADRVKEMQRKEELRQRLEKRKAMKQQDSYQLTSKEEERQKNRVNQMDLEELAEDIRQGRILSRSEDYVDADFDIDALEQEDYVAQIEDLIVMGPYYALSKDRDFLAEADEILWDYKVS